MIARCSKATSRPSTGVCCASQPSGDRLLERHDPRAGDDPAVGGGAVEWTWLDIAMSSPWTPAPSTLECRATPGQRATLHPYSCSAPDHSEACSMTSTTPSL